MSLAADTPVLKHASSTDFTSPLVGFTIALTVLSTAAIVSRTYARLVVKNIGVGADDVFAWLGYFGFLGNLIANFIFASNHIVAGPANPPNAVQLATATNAIVSVGITYPVAVVGGKLSLLCLYRRIFGMRVKWFKYTWYMVLVLVCPIWFVTAIIWASLGIANTVSLQVELNYAVPIITIINTVTDVFMLALPLSMTARLQLTKKQRASIMLIFALGSTGTIVSLIRCIRAFQSQQEHWDQRYNTYTEAMLGAVEAGAIVICSCLPVLRPLIVSAVDFAKSNFSSMSGLTGSTLTATSRSRTRASHASLSSRDYNDDAPINLREGVIHRRLDVDVESIRKEYPVANVSQVGL